MSTRRNDLRKIQFNAPVASNNIDTTTTTTNGSGGGGGMIDTSNTTSVWDVPLMVTILRFIAFISILLLVFDIAVLLMWIFRVIPAIPPSFTYYGAIWYLLFFWTGVLTFFMSWIRHKPMFLITAVILFVSLIVIAFLITVIIYQIVWCFEGVLDASCTDLRFPQLFLLGLSILIGFCILTLLGLFIAVIVRLKQYGRVRYRAPVY